MRQLPDRTLRSLRLGLCVLITSLATLSCSSPGRPLPKVVEHANATLEPVEYRVAPGDTLSFTFPGDGNWNQNVTVDDLGSISLRLVGSYVAGDKTLDEVQEWSTQAYAAHLPDPTTLVTVTTLAPREIYVLGEVRRGGAVTLTGPHMPFLAALGAVGGHDSKVALLEETLLVRWHSGRKTHGLWRIDASPEHWGKGGQLLLQAGDVVYVPKKRIIRVNEWVDHYIRQMLPFPYLVAPLRGG